MSREQRITIGFGGDVMIGRLVNEHLAYVPPSYIWGDLLPLLKTTDLNIVNLEAALTTCNKEVPKVFNFKSDPKNVRVLSEGRIDLVNLANNHVLDYSEEGLIETLNVLDEAGILHVGAGKNIHEAAKAVILERKGVRIGILGCTDNEPTWLAAETRPGTRYIAIGDIQALKNDIDTLRAQVDILIVSIHWGPNMRERPAKGFVQFAHALIDNGVDIIHGHSAHIFQGVETYRNGVILYDTGDFVDDYYVDPRLRNDRSFFFLVEVSKKGYCSFRLVPVLISNFQVNHAPPEDAQESLRRMQVLSAELNFFTTENTEGGKDKG